MMREKNHLEWRNPANWLGLYWLRFYHSSHDTRLWVPKRVPLLGWTINFAHPWGVATMLTIVLVIAVAAAFDHGLISI